MVQVALGTSVPGLGSVKQRANRSLEIQRFDSVITLFRQS